jgi:hypothetical protein
VNPRSAARPESPSPTIIDINAAMNSKLLIWFNGFGMATEASVRETRKSSGK